jgi:hypothetical protein
MRAAVWLIGLLALMALPTGCSTKEVGRSDLPIESDFSDCEGWSDDDDENILLGCTDEQYKVLFKSTATEISHVIPRRSEEPVDSVGVEADVTIATLPGTPAKQFVAVGLGCWISAPDEPLQGYEFLVSPGSHGYAIAKLDETNAAFKKQFYLQILVEGESPAVAGVGDPNHLRGECRGSANAVELRMSLDGEEIDHASDAAGFQAYEAFGFVCYSTEAGTDIRYDNFVAEEIH